jgi:hypothetical protein
MKHSFILILAVLAALDVAAQYSGYTYFIKSNSDTIWYTSTKCNPISCKAFGQPGEEAKVVFMSGSQQLSDTILIDAGDSYQWYYPPGRIIGSAHIFINTLTTYGGKTAYVKCMCWPH